MKHNVEKLFGQCSSRKEVANIYDFAGKRCSITTNTSKPCDSGKGIQAWSTYWLGPAATIQVAYRHATMAKDFIPNGESINDVSVRGTLRLKSDVELQALVQYELWNAKVLAPVPQSNMTGALQLTLWPNELLKKAQ